jgi:hypothetical protein
MRQLQQVAGCTDGQTCPGIWVDEANDVAVIRGDLVPAATLPRADGETVVEIPLGMLLQAARVQ